VSEEISVRPVRCRQQPEISAVILKLIVQRNTHQAIEVHEGIVWVVHLPSPLDRLGVKEAVQTINMSAPIERIRTHRLVSTADSTLNGRLF
jgi:hypothetical protein